MVIDPGHGGGDAGVVGPGGQTEGELVFDLAVRLEKALKKELGVRAVLTREAEGNPAAAERAALANTLGSDLFLSLHAAGYASAAVSGYRVYYQDYRRVSGLGGESAAAGDDPGPRREWILSQAGFARPSRRLADEMDRALVEVLRRRSGGPLGLPLAVLAGASQPAVLIEVGTLTNPEEERRLASDGYRDALVRALVLGLSSWGHWVIDDSSD